MNDCGRLQQEEGLAAVAYVQTGCDNPLGLRLDKAAINFSHIVICNMEKKKTSVVDPDLQGSKTSGRIQFRNQCLD